MIKKTSLMAAICSQAKPPSNNHDDAQYLVGIERVIKRANSIYRDGASTTTLLINHDLLK
jgi:hypothetical protein